MAKEIGNLVEHNRIVQNSEFDLLSGHPIHYKPVLCSQLDV